MGWLIIFAIKPVYLFLGFHGFAFLLAGGLFYTIGAIFTPGVHFHTTIRYGIYLC